MELQCDQMKIVLNGTTVRPDEDRFEWNNSATRWLSTLFVQYLVIYINENEPNRKTVWQSGFKIFPNTKLTL